MDEKALLAMKATLIDDDAFRLLALPYGGPIPYPGAPKGADLDRQWMTADTDFGSPPKNIDVTWHHGKDSVLGREVIGKAGELEFDDDGGWVKVWLDHGKRRTRLIKQLAEAAENDPEVGLYGSSEAQAGSGRLRKGGTEVPWRPKTPGEISRWWYSGQTLSTSPQNTNSILVPIKATLEDLASSEIAPTADYFDDLARFLDNLAPDPASSDEAKAGRVLASRNEARLREAVTVLDGSYSDPKVWKRARELLRSVLTEVEERDAFLRPLDL